MRVLVYKQRANALKPRQDCNAGVPYPCEERRGADGRRRNGDGGDLGRGRCGGVLSSMANVTLRR